MVGSFLPLPPLMVGCLLLLLLPLQTLLVMGQGPCSLAETNLNLTIQEYVGSYTGLCEYHDAWCDVVSLIAL